MQAVNDYAWIHHTIANNILESSETPSSLYEEGELAADYVTCGHHVRRCRRTSPANKNLRRN